MIEYDIYQIIAVREMTRGTIVEEVVAVILAVVTVAVVVVVTVTFGGTHIVKYKSVVKVIVIIDS